MVGHAKAAFIELSDVHIANWLIGIAVLDSAALAAVLAAFSHAFRVRKAAVSAKLMLN